MTEPATFTEAIRFWEWRRVGYNLALTAQSAAWVVVTWPHFQPALTFASLGKMLVLAVLANLCYSAVYAAEAVFANSSFAAAWSRRRWILWLAGTLFALLVAQYWIGDEIYPDVR